MKDFKEIKKWLADADAVIVTAGNGFAQMEGLDMFDNLAFPIEYKNISEKYHVKTIELGVQSSNDYILNTLLTLLPKNIFIHLIDNYKDEFINTLELIFEKRIHICTNCDICEFYKSHIKTNEK